MKRICLPVLFLLTSLFAVAQHPVSLTPEQRKTDEAIDSEIIWPAVNDAQHNESTPDWESLRKNLSSKYDVACGNRAVIRGKIFFNFNKDWKVFNECLVEYTEKYEDRGDAHLMNKNAGMILQHSTDKVQLQKALTWSKMALDKEPDNDVYRKTSDDLKAKIASL